MKVAYGNWSQVLLRLALAIMLLTVPMWSGAALAQDQSNVRFDSGKSSATISGTVVGKRYIDYVLRAKAGQRMDVSLKVDGTNGDGTIYFNVLPYGSDYNALFIGSNEGSKASVKLPSDGRWVIRVYLMGNDRDTGKTVGFLIGVKISAGGGNSENKPSLGKNWYQQLVGVSARSAVGQLDANGYRQVDSFESGADGVGSVWYGRALKQCLQLIIVNGRVDSSVDIQTHPQCR